MFTMESKLYCCAKVIYFYMKAKINLIHAYSVFALKKKKKKRPNILIPMQPEKNQILYLKTFFFLV